MKKIIFYFFIPFLISFNSLAQKTISGSVMESGNDKPVISANVIIKGTYTGTYTNADGKFKLTVGNQMGEIVLKISHISFNTNEITVDPNSNAEINIELTSKPVLADEVIVSATRANKNSATTYTQISKEGIENQNLGQDIPFLLEQTPSMVITSDAGAGVGYTGLRIRGSDQSRINVTVNGIPYNDPESQNVYWVDLPDFASSVDNIQIQRGVGTSTNGAGAFGGTINIQTETLNSKPYAELSGSYGSFNTWKATLKLGTGLIKDKFTFDGRLSKIASDGYIDRAESDLSSFFVSGGYYGKKNILRVNVFSGLEKTYQAWWGTPENLLKSNRTYNYYNYKNEIDKYRQDHYQAMFSQQIGKYWVLNTALHYTRGKGYYEQYKGPEYNNDAGFNSKQAFADYGLENIIFGNDTIIETSLIRRRQLDNHFYGATFSTIYENKQVSFAFGGAWNRFDGQHFGEIIWAEFASNGAIGHRYYENKGIKTDLNFYAKASYLLLKKINLFADLQYRRVTHTIEGTDNDHQNLLEDHTLNFINPKVGLSYSINNHHEIYASFALGNREPSRDDYVNAGITTTPKSESLRNIEVGYRFKKRRNFFSANYYLMHYKDQLVLTGELNDVGNAIRANVDKSYRMGIELSNQLILFKKLTWDANFTYSINKIKAFTETLYVYDPDYEFLGAITENYSNTDISFSPSIIAGSVIAYEPLKGLKFAFISKYVGEQFLDNTSNENRKLDDYFVGNFHINYVIKNVFFKEIGISLLINNLFNAKYESNGYSYSEVYDDGSLNRTRADYNYYYPQAGINVLAGITLKY